jgi:hypothetical protein
MADAGDLKSPARFGRVGSNPTSATVYIRIIPNKNRDSGVKISAGFESTNDVLEINDDK